MPHTTLLTFPCFSKSDLLSLASSVSDEGVLSLAARFIRDVALDQIVLRGAKDEYLLGITAGLPGFRLAPVVVTAGAAGAGEANVLEYARRVELLGICLELWARQSFDFLKERITNFDQRSAQTLSFLIART